MTQNAEYFNELFMDNAFHKTAKKIHIAMYYIEKNGISNPVLSTVKIRWWDGHACDYHI